MLDTESAPAPAPALAASPAPVTDMRMTFARSETIAAFGAALAKAQGSMKHAEKDRTNPHFKSAYATMASVYDACREALSANGIAVTQMPITTKEGVSVTTLMIHSSGEWMSSTIDMPIAKRDAQGIGSAITYARRYALSSMAGVAQVDDENDDDGNGAADRDHGAGGRDDDGYGASDDAARAEQKRREQQAAKAAAMKGAQTQPKAPPVDEEAQVKTAARNALIARGVTAQAAQVAEVTRINGGKMPETIDAWRKVTAAITAPQVSA